MTGSRRPDREFLRERALEALEGVGDTSLGPWEEWSGFAFHIRRRLTPAEQEQVGEARDIRGTPEQDKRHAAVRRFLPRHLRNFKE